MHVGVGFTEMLLAVVMLFGGGAAVAPVGVPMEPDAGLQSAAPPECLFYFSYAGQGTPQADSKNQVEALFAEPEIQAFLGELDRLINEGLKKIPADNDEQRVVAENLPVVVRTLLSRPAILYLAQVDVPGGPGGKPPGGNAAIVVNAGDRAAAVVNALEEFEKLYLANIPSNQPVEKIDIEGVGVRRLPMPPGAPPLAWGRKDDYIFIALGEEEAAAVVKRLGAKAGPPQWLVDLHKTLAVPRPTATTYLNVAAIVKTVEPLFPLLEQNLPPPLNDVGKLLDTTGLKHLKYVAVGAGLDVETAVSKFVVAHDGAPEGLLSIGSGKPLGTDDFKAIPADVEFATVGRFDAGQTYQLLRKLAEKIAPAEAIEQFDHEIKLAEDAIGVDLEDDLLAGIGDKWSLYSSASQGGLLFTGLCLQVNVRDQAKIERVIEQVLRRLDFEMRRNDDKIFDVRKTTVGGKTISYAQFSVPSPVVPAWCFDGNSLIVALSPQMVRAHVTRPAGDASLADSKLVQRHLASGDVTSLSYQDTHLGLQFLYSYAQYLATAVPVH
ncbi:MAG: hypothetical protein QM775_03040 [Pirellulales bacterium]